MDSPGVQCELLGLEFDTILGSKLKVMLIFNNEEICLYMMKNPSNIFCQTAPANNTLFVETVLANKSPFDIRVPPNKTPFDKTVAANELTTLMPA